MDQEHLVIQARKGNDQAFYDLMIANREKLYRMAYSYFHNEDDALEAVQEVTYRAFKQLKKLKEPAFFSTWLVRILINYCNDEMKRKGKVVAYEAFESKELLEEDHAEKLDLKTKIQMLRKEYQHVIILRYFHDLAVPEIARILEKPEGTIKTWQHQALKELKVAWKDGEATCYVK